MLVWYYSHLLFLLKLLLASCKNFKWICFRCHIREQDKPALVTYSDLALNLLLQLGAAAMSYNFAVDDLTDHVAEVLEYFG
ncbi:hypothetical protein L1987_30282 [Smallanthus sonchifolius]|uniref:Uncharacterized protein n=1 Tax=Smallanthus sonchifolius TaxID=185202 RepID=A0ACB9I2D9_9ASTR|nr:hypothetical protein L1987_30282 [Smallanthus sonchifolius]